MKYTQAYNGEWVYLRSRRHYIKCCACGLTHRLEFRIVGGRYLQYRAFRLRRRRRRARSR